jgi:hypothetical protein
LYPSISEQDGFVSGSYSDDYAHKKRASDEIIDIFSRHFERLFINYQTFGGAFLYKTPSQSSELGIHQDWTIVDEEKYVALNCWVPLIDVNERNGALHVLPGSQYTKRHTLRAPTIPFFFTGSEKEVISMTIPFYVKAGEAVILNQSIIHYSPPNLSGKIRKAITAGVKTIGAPMVFNYKNTAGQLERFQMPEDFLISFQNFAKSIFEQPKGGTLIGTYDYKEDKLDKEELIPLLTDLKSKAGYATTSPFFLTRILSKIRGV